MCNFWTPPDQCSLEIIMKKAMGTLCYPSYLLSLMLHLYMRCRPTSFFWTAKGWRLVHWLDFKIYTNLYAKMNYEIYCLYPNQLLQPWSHIWATVDGTVSDLPAKRIAYTIRLDSIFVLWFYQIIKGCLRPLSRIIRFCVTLSLRRVGSTSPIPCTFSLLSEINKTIVTKLTCKV